MYSNILLSPMSEDESILNFFIVSMKNKIDEMRRLIAKTFIDIILKIYKTIEQGKINVIKAASAFLKQKNSLNPMPTIDANTGPTSMIFILSLIKKSPILYGPKL